MAETRTESRVRHGIDLEEFHEFVEYATENPGDVQFELGRALALRGATVPQSGEDRRLHPR